MKRSYIVLLLASVSLMATACGSGDSEPKTTEKVVTTVQEATEATEAVSRAASSYSSNSYQRHEEGDSGFEEYLKENDPDSYDFYQELEDNWDAGNWTPENGFLGGY